MTENGTFIITGTERVIVSQLHRSSVLFFRERQHRSYFLGEDLPSAGLGWSFEYAPRHSVRRIDRQAQVPGLDFLARAAGSPTKDILRRFIR